MGSDDLINRQAAITIPVTPKEDREYQTYNLDDAYEQAWDDLQKRIEQLPSAQPKVYTKADYVMALHKEYGCTITMAQEAHNKALEYLRSKATVKG